MNKKSKNIILATALISAGITFALMIVVNSLFIKSSSNESCMSCHVHTDADAAWSLSSHYNNESGVKTDCAACHLPPAGSKGYMAKKMKIGIKDIWVYLTKDHEKIDWDVKGELENASKIVYNESCESCHVNIYPKDISDDGITAHLYYDDHKKDLDLQCISCHLDVGHYNPDYKHERMTGVPKIGGNKEKFAEAKEINAFENFTETIPGTSVSFNMIAIPGGSFTIGSPQKEKFRKSDEGPQKNINVSRFFMAEVETTWDQYWSFFAETMSEGRTPPEKIYANNSREDVDAVSGPTPAFGNPDQGWGAGDRPAITMTHYAARTFCQWLSLKTGKKYRLPSEAEWEYAARGGSQSAYFFEGKPEDYSNEGFWNGLFGADTTVINGFTIYQNNSRNRTAEPSKVKANGFGLKNMLGNVMEYCEDWYAEDAYSNIKDGESDPKGPQSGTERVVRGGSYNSDAADIRSAARSHTKHDAWLKTDPQNPKSIWWYSDIKGIGFRVVCEVPENIK